MTCKQCGKEVADEHEFCPFCGNKLNPEAEAPAAEPAEKAVPEMKPGITSGKLALTIAAVLVVLAVLVAVLVGGMKAKAPVEADPTDESIPAASEAQTEPEETTPPTIPADGNPDDETCKGSYTVTDEEAASLGSNVVANIGDVKLNNGTLQVYYWMEVFAFLQQYGSYASYLGLDISQPLDMQVCEVGDTSMTWQQYFLHAALESWHAYEAMELAAQDAGYQLSDDVAENLAAMPEQIKEMAEQNGFESVEDLVKANVGAGVSMDDYIRYITTYTRGFEYYDDLCEALSITDEEIEAYFAENEQSFADSGITKDTRYVDVRHILIMPEGGTVDENGKTVHTEEEWEAAKVKAQDTLDFYLAGDKTEEDFASLAGEYSQDPGSKSNGGLYESVSLGQMVEPFETWCFDASRQVGDTGLVKTDYGYHVMFFVGDKQAWYTDSRQQLIESMAAAIVPENMEKYPMEVDYSSIALAVVDMSAA